MADAPPFRSITFSMPLFFNEDGSIDFATFERYVAACCASDGVELLYSMAYNTRYMQLTEDEIVAVNGIVCEQANAAGKGAIIGHPIMLSRDGLARYCQRVAEFKPWALAVLMPERYYDVMDPVIDYMTAPADAGLNTLVHEMKLVSGFNGSLVDWPHDLLDVVMSLDTVVGIKEDSKEDSLSRHVIEQFAQKKHVILAGGGKVRARKFFDAGLVAWLNGSLMLHPAAARRTYEIFTGQDDAAQQQYLDTVEIPYFSEVVAKHGWHVAHKAALEVAGFGKRHERSPMTVMGNAAFAEVKPIVESVLEGLKAFESVASA